MLGQFISNFHNQDLTAVLQDVTENDNWKKCFNINGNALAVCIYNCEDNGDCERVCISQFKEDNADCPCEVSQIIYDWYKMTGHTRATARHPTSKTNLKLVQIIL